MREVTDADVEAGLVELERRCEKAGLPVTIQRRAVYESLLPRNDHPTVDEIYNGVRAKLNGVSKATIYRALETLTDLGLARKVPHPGSAVRFDPFVEPHHHLLCQECGAMQDHHDEELHFDSPGGAFLVHEASALFVGLCASCAPASKPD